MPESHEDAASNADTHQEVVDTVIMFGNDEEQSAYASELEWEDEREARCTANDNGDDNKGADIEAPTSPESNIGLLLEPVIAEPVNDSLRDLPVVDISRQDQEVIPIPGVKEEEENNGADSQGVIRIAKTIRNSLLPKRRQVVTVDVEATPIQEVSDRTMGIDDNDDDDDRGGSPSSQTRTAQFISARVVRNRATNDLGFKIRMEGNTHVVTEVKEDGLLANSPILNGDKLISINNNSCLGMKLPGIQRLVETVDDHVTITVHNPTGNPSLVECYVMKPQPSSKLGLDLMNHTHHRRLRSSSRMWPLVASIDTEGLMVDSLLNPADEILSVNGHSVSDTRAVRKVLSKIKSPHITILARTKDRTAAVVTTEPEQGTRSRRFDLYGIPARARRLHRRNGRANHAYDSARICCNVGALILAAMVVATPTKNGLFITSTNWVFATFTLFALVNAPWQFRKIGQRLSPLQVLCNLLVMANMAYVWFGTSNVEENSAVIWFCAFYVPLLGLVNTPSCFPEVELDDSSVNEVEDSASDGEGHHDGVCTV